MDFWYFVTCLNAWIGLLDERAMPFYLGMTKKMLVCELVCVSDHDSDQTLVLIQSNAQGLV